MAAAMARNPQGNWGLNQSERAELRRFENCSEAELASFRPQTLARYRALMMAFSAGLRMERRREPQTAA